MQHYSDYGAEPLPAGSVLFHLLARGYAIHEMAAGEITLGALLLWLARTDHFADTYAMRITDDDRSCTYPVDTGEHARKACARRLILTHFLPWIDREIGQRRRAPRPDLHGGAGRSLASRRADETLDTRWPLTWQRRHA